jgi:hypothetical protein
VLDWNANVDAGESPYAKGRHLPLSSRWFEGQASFMRGVCATNSIFSLESARAPPSKLRLIVDFMK